MAKDRVQRRLAAILAADVVGYSRLMGLDEESTLRTLQAYREIIDRLIVRHEGRIFTTGGDSVLAEFASPVEAVRCAIAIQEELTFRNTELVEDRQMHFRIGINVGDVMVEGDNLFGDGVNVAARLEGIAEAGGICISGSTFDQVRNKLSIGFEDIGPQKVKNIAEPVPAFRVGPGQASIATTTATPAVPRRWRLPAIAAALVVISAAGGLAWLQPWAPRVEPASVERMAPALPDKPSIAVLPFTNMSDDPSQEYFVDGMTEDLITDLAKIESLFVIARNTVFTYKGKSVVVPDVARELGVKYVLEGSVRRVGDMVRINTQLIDGASGAHIWAERYDGALTDIFALQDEVTSAIIAQLQITLTPDEQNRRNGKDTDNLDAHDAYLRGWQLYRRYTPEDFVKAIPHLEKAVELDPDYGQAWAALASVYWITHRKGTAWSLIVNPDKSNSVSWNGARDKTQIYLRQAMRNPTPLAHQIESQISWDYRQFERALSEARQAVALDQNDPEGHLAMAWALIFSGRAEAAIASTETAIRLDPTFPGSHLFALGTAQLMLERYDEAQATLQRALAFIPEDSGIMVPLSIANARTGRQEEAKAALQNYKSIFLVNSPKIENYMPWWPFMRETDIRLFGGGLIKAGLCCQDQLEVYIGKLRQGGTLE
ncbi:MAG: tetratricopeptide repeat protein [Proteobacteria bacterium]|nr:tetratricopeptide repeat protein [Pseudomonadota bacterium]